MALRNPQGTARWPERSAPKLLLEREPAHRVFLANLAEVIARRNGAPRHLKVETLPFWRDVFVPPGEFGWALLESALWHVMALLMLVVFYRGPSIRTEEPPVRRSEIVYYKADPTFPARAARPPRNFTQKNQSSKTQKVLRVAREAKARRGWTAAPPALASLTEPGPLASSMRAPLVAPAMPLAAVPPSERQSPQIGGSVIAPPPDVRQATGRQGGGFGNDVVAPAPTVGGGLEPMGAGAPGGFSAVVVPPAPTLGGVSGRREMAGPGGVVRAVPPAPVLQGDSLEKARRAGNGNLLHMVVVAPPPSVPTEGPGSLRRQARAGFGGGGGPVVPPAPSAQGLETGRAGQGGGSFGSGVAAVPPAPSAAGAEGLNRRAYGNLSGGTLAAVPPSPSLRGKGKAISLGRARGSFGGAGAAGVVPPPPSARGLGNGRAGQGRGSFGQGVAAVPPAPSVDGVGEAMVGPGGLGTGDAGDSAVPPPPSVNGAGGLSGRGSGGFSGESTTAVPPAPSLGGMAGGTGRGGEGLADASSVVPPSPSMESMINSNLEQNLKPVVLDMPLRIVALAFALPSTSFASSYEVFLAQAELRGHRQQLIKLVYWFLPYQERLSDFKVESSRMYKLRVTRDHACDESLAHMTASSEGQVYPDPDSPIASLLASPGIRDLSLPCYRTTADDYRKAVSGKH